MVELGEGERAYRRQSRRKTAVVGALFLGGALVGGVIGFLDQSPSRSVLDMNPTPGVAIGIVVAFVLLVGIGTKLWWQRMDEVERRGHLVANSWASAVMVMGYPIWFVLWRGGLVVEPQHTVLFAATILAGALSAIV
jgi:hypothetical protein